MKPGDRVGRYELEELLGEGAMGQVFAARQPLRERRLAIKVLRPEAAVDDQYIKRFLGDARAADALDHPNIVRIIDFYETPEAAYIVMELIEGRSLEAHLGERGPLGIEEASRIAYGIATGLAAAHEAGIVHRDVKPSNILIDRRTGAAKLTDFGAAKRMQPDGPTLSFHGQLIGTPQYMAPEQIDGRPVSPRTDLFSLGSTFYEMLTGVRAFGGESLAAQLHAVLLETPASLAQLRPDAPSGLVRLVEQLLAKAPEARPASALAVADALAPFARGTAPVDGPEAAAGRGASGKPEPVTARAGDEPGPEAAAARAGRGLLRPPVLIGAAVLVVLIAVGLWLLQPAGGPETTPQKTAAKPGAPSQPPASPPAAATGAPEPSPTPPRTAAEAPARPQPEGNPPQPQEAGAAQQPSEAEATTGPSRPQAPAAEMPHAAAPDPGTVKAALAGISCLSATPEVGSDGRVRITGTAGAPEVAREATAKVADVIGVSGVDNRLQIIAAPGCYAAKQVQDAIDDGVSPPTLKLNRPDGVYRDKEFLVAEVQMPSQLAGFLYLDLFNDNGAVIHLLPEPLQPKNELPADGRIRVGVESAERRAGVRDWQVGPPFGAGYVVATASEKPLYVGLRPITEPLEPYLKMLLASLSSAEARPASARVDRIEFRPGR